MPTSEYSTADAVVILTDLAHVIRASPRWTVPSSNDRLAKEIEAVAAAAAHDAQLASVDIDKARECSAGGWARPILAALFPAGADEQILARMDGRR